MAYTATNTRKLKTAINNCAAAQVPGDDCVYRLISLRNSKYLRLHMGTGWRKISTRVPRVGAR